MLMQWKGRVKDTIVIKNKAGFITYELVECWFLTFSSPTGKGKHISTGEVIW